MKFDSVKMEVFATICVGMALRSIVSLQSYSGAGKPPMHGDYEAQRHWQEITVNLPPQHWYRNSSRNDLQYWGLDYPPLTAHHSHIVGAVAKSANAEYVELVGSRGYESADHKSFMRLSVLLADLVLYIPCVWQLAAALKKQFAIEDVLPAVLLFMLYPGQILIDNGHFQYNNISLGLFAVAVASVLSDHLYSATLFFTLALNYKQMELYHALPFFVYLLRKCLSQKSFSGSIRKFCTIAGIVLLTFAILWLPWLNSFDSVLSVVKRLFPIGRGVFEDKVANVWCAVNVIYKLKQKLENTQMAVLCLMTTLAAVLPINGHLFVNPGKDKFLYGLINTAMAFFLFSFQVHEKSILLVAVPAMMLFPLQPVEMYWLLEVTVFSMLPLFIKDELTLPYFCMLLIFYICIKLIYINNLSGTSKLHKYSTITTSLIFLISLIAIAMPAPARYPDLWPLLISVFSCGHFALFLIYGTLSQFNIL